MTVYEFKTVEITHDYIPWVIAVSHIDYTFLMCYSCSCTNLKFLVKFIKSKSVSIKSYVCY